MAPKPLQVLSDKGGGGYITEGDSHYIGYNVWGIRSCGVTSRIE